MIYRREIPFLKSLKMGFGICGCFIFMMIQTAVAQGVAEEGNESLQEVRKKYAEILQLAPEKLENLNMYLMLDRWPEFFSKNGEQIKGQEQAVFAQYIYYLVFNTKIPSEPQLIFEDQKTYPFKNTVYLRSGDLLFFGKAADQPEQVGVHLQNGIIAYPAGNGSLHFISLKEIEEEYRVTAAKILKDEEEAG